MRFVAMAMALGLASPAMAQSLGLGQTGEDSVYGRVGVIFANTDTRLRIDAPDIGTEGSQIDLETDLELDSGRALFSGEVGYRFSKDWSVQFEFLNYSRKSSKSLEKTLIVEDVEYDIGAAVETEFKSTLYKLDVHWVPVKSEQGRLGFSLGLHATNFEFGIGGQASLEGETTGFQQIIKEQLAPLPTIGIQGAYRIIDNVYVYGMVDFFSLKIDKYKGTLIDAEAGVTWQAMRNVGIGASWRILDYGVTITGDSFTGKIDYKLSGPMLFLTFGF